MEQNRSHSVGFEPTRVDPNTLAMCRLDRSAKSAVQIFVILSTGKYSCSKIGRKQQMVQQGLVFDDEKYPNKRTVGRNVHFRCSFCVHDGVPEYHKKTSFGRDYINTNNVENCRRVFQKNELYYGHICKKGSRILDADRYAQRKAKKRSRDIMESDSNAESNNENTKRQYVFYATDAERQKARAEQKRKCNKKNWRKWRENQKKKFKNELMSSIVEHLSPEFRNLASNFQEGDKLTTNLTQSTNESENCQQMEQETEEYDEMLSTNN